MPFHNLRVRFTKLLNLNGVWRIWSGGLPRRLLEPLERRHFAPVPVSVQGGTTDVGRGGVERASVHVCGADGDRRRGYMIR